MNNFQITVSASDKATAVIKGINQAVAKVTRPIAEIGKASKAAGKAAGFDKLGAGLKRIVGVAGEAEKKLGTLKGPLGFLSGAGTIAGLTALANEWGRFGVELTNTASAAGLAASTLSGVRAASQLAGVSGSTATGAMKSLNDTLNDARYGRNMLALGVLNQLGITLHRTKDGAIDNKRALDDLLNAIARQPNAGTQNKIAQLFGIEGLLTADVRQLGAAALAAREKMAALTGETMTPAQTQQANAFGRSLNNVKSAIAGIGNAIEFDLMPWMQPVADGFVAWETRNRQTAAHMAEIGAVAGVAAGGIAALSGALAGLGLIGGVLATGGIALAVGALAAAVYALGPANLARSREAAANGFTIDDQGNVVPLPGAATAAAAVPAGSRAPRGIRNNNPLNLRSWGSTPVVGGYAKFATPQEGIDAAAKQLLLYQGRGINTLGGIVSSWAPSADGNDVAAYTADLAKQTGFGADQHLNLRDPAVLANVLSAMIRHENGQNPYSRDMLAAEAQKVEVEVHFRNAPAGVTATARSGGGDSRSLPVRVHYSMPEGTLP